MHVPPPHIVRCLVGNCCRYFVPPVGHAFIVLGEQRLKNGVLSLCPRWAVNWRNADTMRAASLLLPVLQVLAGSERWHHTRGSCMAGGRSSWLASVGWRVLRSCDSPNPRHLNRRKGSATCTHAVGGGVGRRCTLAQRGVARTLQGDEIFLRMKPRVLLGPCAHMFGDQCELPPRVFKSIPIKRVQKPLVFIFGPLSSLCKTQWGVKREK